MTNVKPHSGVQINIFAFIHSLKPGDKIIGKGMNAVQSGNQVRGGPVIYLVNSSVASVPMLRCTTKR